MAINSNPKCPARKPRPRIPSISKVRHQRLKEYAKLRARFLHDKPRCEFPGCKKRSEDIHHKRGRIGRLLCMSEHFCAVCRPHHHFIHENPKIARENGMLCELGMWGKV